MAGASNAATRAATLVGFGAILLWSSLALLTTIAEPPPFLGVAVAFSVAAVLGMGKRLYAREPLFAAWRQPRAAWALGLAGLFGYHACYFAALSLAPPVEATLVNYLWPLLIVLFAGLLPGERLRWFHLGGAALGLIGCVLIVAPALDAPASAARNPLAGYAFAAAAALLWAGYSVLSRRLANVPSDAVAGFCAGTAALAWACHFLFEPSFAGDAAAWAIMAAMGLGPVGLAFYLWDIGMKRGDIKALGAASYLTPLLSTGLLLLAGRGTPSLALALAAALIVGGAVLASKDMLRR
ncbi:MAG: EamA family transporter [Telmatospirillum sp.]|nr:EamA family transporter [Telmatospirillum sp.]